MFSLLTIMMMAPVPVGPVAVTPPPRVLELTADADGKVRLLVQRKETVKVNYTYTEVVDGVQTTKIGTRDEQVPVVKRVPLSEVKELSIATADGKDVDRPTLLKKLEEGGAVVILSADGRKIAPKYLKLLRDDTIVLTAEELAVPTAPIMTPPAGNIRLRPLPLPLAPIAPPVPALPEPPAAQVEQVRPAIDPPG